MNIRIAIIEDEPATARHLQYLLQDAEPGILVVHVLASISDSVAWLQDNMMAIDLLFMDIQLSDGMSFEIFDKIKINKPVIFVTAYNEYALQAFKANGIDYILKPFDTAELQQALAKFRMLGNKNIDDIHLKHLAEAIRKGTYRQSFLVQFRDKLIPVSVTDIAWFYTQNEMVYICTTDNKKYTVDYTLEQLQNDLNPLQFYRANRQFIIHRNAIQEIDFYFNGRLMVKVIPQPDEKILISKARVTAFKIWMNM